MFLLLWLRVKILMQLRFLAYYKLWQANVLEQTNKSKLSAVAIFLILCDLNC
jgi:hypothetical protein